MTRKVTSGFILGEDMDIKLEKLAQLAIEIGANVQKGQYVVINGDVKIAAFLQRLAKLAYEKGAREVFVNYSDEQLSLLDYTYLSVDDLKEFPLWKQERIKDQLMKDCVRISVNTINPKLYADVSAEKMNAGMMEMRKVMNELRKDAPDNNTQWLGFCLPTKEWADEVFKGDSEAYEKLCDVFYEVLGITEDNDPVAVWKEHVDEILRHRQILTDKAFKKLIFKNSLGTDVTIDLVDNHQWCGGAEFTRDNVAYTPNLPTEEIFCIPHKNGVTGKIVATKPLNVMGKLVEDFWFRFEDGKVVDYDARVNKEVLTKLLSTDEGAKHLGEVALVANSSAISAKNVLFYTTLFDENASCHVALGQCYASNFKDVNMSKEEKEAAGGNFSAVHCDFMFGSSDLSVVGITGDNEEITIMKNGEFVI